jgi:hypothetical protein
MNGDPQQEPALEPVKTPEEKKESPGNKEEGVKAA